MGIKTEDISDELPLIRVDCMREVVGTDVVARDGRFATREVVSGDARDSELKIITGPGATGVSFTIYDSSGEVSRTGVEPLFEQVKEEQGIDGSCNRSLSWDNSRIRIAFNLMNTQVGFRCYERPLES